jgi:hypothetical protein
MRVLLKNLDLLAIAALGGNGLRNNTLHAAHVASFGNLTSVLDGDRALNAGNHSRSGGLGWGLV